MPKVAGALSLWVALEVSLMGWSGGCWRTSTRRLGRPPWDELASTTSCERVAAGVVVEAVRFGIRAGWLAAMALATGVARPHRIWAMVPGSALRWLCLCTVDRDGTSAAAGAWLCGGARDWRWFSPLLPSLVWRGSGRHHCGGLTLGLAKAAASADAGVVAPAEMVVVRRMAVWQSSHLIMDRGWPWRFEVPPWFVTHSGGCWLRRGV